MKQAPQNRRYHKNISSRRATPKSHPRRGATTVEFALAVTILIMIVFASVEFVRLSILRHSVEYASYLGARKAVIIGAHVNEAKNAATDHLTVMGLSGGSVSVNPNNINDETEIVEVVVTVPVSGNSWVSPIYFSGNLTGRTRILTERVAADMASAAGVSSP